MTLEYARSLAVEPGTNRRGEQADTSWLFLMPTLDLDEAVVVGSAPFGTLVALAALGLRLKVLRPAAPMRRRMRRLSTTAVDTEVSVTREIPRSGRSLVYISSSAASRVAKDEAVLGRLDSVLARGGAVYVGPRRNRRVRGGLVLARRLGIEPFIVVGDLSAAPGPPRAGRAATWAIPAVVSAPGRLGPQLRRLLRIGRRLLRRLLRRRVSTGAARISDPGQSLGVERITARPQEPPPASGLLMRPAPGRADDRLPQYLLDAAEAAGRPLVPTGWRLAPPRGYRSQNVIFFVRSADGTDLVVKVTQDPRFNHMLENEARALEALEGIELGDVLATPRLRFRSAHQDLAIVAEDLIPGQPFVSAAPPAEPESELASAVIRGLTALGARTAVPADAVAEALLDILGHYQRVYAPPLEHARLLEANARRLGELEPKLPCVFMQGDSTVYNVLVDESPRAGLVDWENAEPAAGLPLWDVLHFLLHYAIWSAECEGVRFTPRVFADRFLEGAGIEPLRSGAIATYCDEVGVPDDAIGPLLHMWLMRHAVREAKQLPPSRLGKGVYHRYLLHLLGRSADDRPLGPPWTAETGQPAGLRGHERLA